ncbi:DUF1353 domain-containing protein [Chondrinema litorale]|uniref:DUF1353 domain-containing protein n=1 Tax=Chondrinema litorale TaxID=2994555 RepID=UPI002543F2C2|nr:DUF1353 domain-containing protein [Chondrinema litorale]UZR98061.1 DUF1353 domain-containing protein [Chondrinema litorale]
MKNYLILVYAVLCYVAGITAITCYAIFLYDPNLLPFIEQTRYFSLSSAVLVNASIIFLFGLQHSLMGRNSFKKKIKWFLPKSAVQSTYIFFSSILLIVLISDWQPLPIKFFDLRGTIAGTVMKLLFFISWLMLIISSFQIDHFHIFGLKQAWLQFRKVKSDRAIFRVPLLYQLVRHPIYLFTIIFHWATPVMTVDRLILAVGVTIYIYIEIIFEEEELVDTFGRKYLDYSNDVPPLFPTRIKNMVLPVAILGFIFFITTSNKQKETQESIEANTKFFPNEITLKEVKGSEFKELIDEELVFIDSAGEKWSAPKGTFTDGASVPRLALWMTDGRFSEEFLKAAIIHDAYCQTENKERCPDQYRKKPWESVHRMFYEACIASGTTENKADIMFAAIWLAGPRWNDPYRSLENVPETVLAQEFEACKKWIEKKNPSVEEIETWMNKREVALLAIEP